MDVKPILGNNQFSSIKIENTPSTMLPPVVQTEIERGSQIIYPKKEFFTKVIATFETLSLPIDTFSPRDFYQDTGINLRSLGYTTITDQMEGKYAGTCAFNSNLIQSALLDWKGVSEMFVGEDEKYVYMKGKIFPPEEILFLESLNDILQNDPDKYDDLLNNDTSNVLFGPRTLKNRLAIYKLLTNKIYAIEKNLIQGDSELGLSQCFDKAKESLQDKNSTLSKYMKNRFSIEDPTTLSVQKTESSIEFIHAEDSKVVFTLSGAYFNSFSTSQPPYVHMLARLSHAMLQELREASLLPRQSLSGTSKDESIISAIMNRDAFIAFTEYSALLMPGGSSTLLGNERWRSIKIDAKTDVTQLIAKHFCCFAPSPRINGSHATSFYIKSEDQALYYDTMSKEVVSHSSFADLLEVLGKKNTSTMIALTQEEVKQTYEELISKLKGLLEKHD
jgi:hypothetical protein